MIGRNCSLCVGSPEFIRIFRRDFIILWKWVFMIDGHQRDKLGD